jgi:3-mercaptopyruvate sulfurtransferase SseA
MLEVDRATRRTSQLIAARAEQETQGQAQQTRPDKMGHVKNAPGKRQEHREHQDAHEIQ